MDKMENAVRRNIKVDPTHFDYVSVFINGWMVVCSEL